MNSTGNDIVALRATQPERTSLPRFYSRILTIPEQQRYRELDSPKLAFDHYVWLCWSIKESTYKFNKRNFPDLVFSPLKIDIIGLLPPEDADGGYYRCRVSCRHGMLYARSLLQEGVVATIVSEDEQFANTRWGFQPIGSSARADQSAAVRALLLQQLKTTLRRDDLQLQKDRWGCPIVLAGQQPTGIPVSLAHHDRYVAWSFYYSGFTEYNSL
jgi:phosphopantetheinyl transferase (holo-ACP synthase)